jgi:AcrR family transcriptional regulator
MDNELAQTRRKGILDAAMTAFDRQGYTATTVDDIAAAAGISKGSIYNYFRSKQDLFSQLFNRAIAKDEADVDALLAVGSPAGRKLCDLLDYWHHGLEVDLKIGRLTLEFWAAAARDSDDSPLAENLHASYERMIARIRQFIQSGIERGEFDPAINAEASARLFIGLIHGLMLQAILGIGPPVDGELLTSFKNLFLTGLGAKSGPAGKGSNEDE